MERNPPHPGEILLEKHLTPLGVTQAALARHLKVSLKTIHEIVHGKRGLTPRMAWLLSQAFGTTPEYWMDLQTAWALSKGPPKRKVGKLEKQTSQLPLLALDGRR